MKTIHTLLTVAAAAAVVAGCTSTGPLASPQQAFAAPVMGADALYSLGRYYYGQQKYDEALKAYGSLLALDPANVDALNAIGAIRSLRGEAQAAEQAFRAAIAIAPQVARSYNNLGYHLLRSGQPSQALTQFQQARALSPRDEQVEVNMAMARARLEGSTQQAGAPVAVEPSAPVAAAATPEPATTPEPQPTVALVRVQDGIYELRPAHAPGITTAASEKPAAEKLATVAPSPVVAITTDLPVTLKATVTAARVEISNGNGITGLARRVAQQVSPGSRLTNSKPFATAVSRIQYTAGYEQAAREIGARLPKPLPLAQVAHLDRANVRVLLGKDFPRNPAAVAVASSEPAQPSHSHP